MDFLTAKHVFIDTNVPLSFYHYSGDDLEFTTVRANPRRYLCDEQNRFAALNRQHSFTASHFPVLTDPAGHLSAFTD